jgi:hypothetical protein
VHDTVVASLCLPVMTGLEMYSHLLKLPHLRQLTVWPAPPQLALSDFWCGADRALLYVPLKLSILLHPQYVHQLSTRAFVQLSV